MSRTRKRPYTKSKRFDRSCRNHGSCPYCKNTRTYNDRKGRASAEDDLKAYKEGGDSMYDPAIAGPCDQCGTRWWPVVDVGGRVLCSDCREYWLNESYYDHAEDYYPVDEGEY